MRTILSRLGSEGKHNIGALDYFQALEEGLSSFFCDHDGLIAFRDPLVSLSPPFSYVASSLPLSLSRALTFLPLSLSLPLFCIGPLACIR
jgi:hypothetical protein